MSALLGDAGAGRLPPPLQAETMKAIFDPALALAKLEEWSGPRLSLVDNSGDLKDRQIQTWLGRLATDSRSGYRPYLRADDDVVAAIQVVAADAPNFALAVRIFAVRAKASAVSGAPFRAPPTLILGPAGIGKTYVAGRIAKALGVPSHEISFASDTSINRLAGTDRVWRTPKIGLVTRALVENDCASPLIVLDEIDKALKAGPDYEPLEPLHAALEPLQAARFHDNYLELDVAADRVLWIATANDISCLSPSLRDRFQIIHVAQPDRAQMRTIARRLYRRAAEAYGDWFDAELSEEGAVAVADERPRHAARVMDEACALAAAAGRRHLSALDLRAAVRSVCGEPRRERMSFV